MIVVSNSSPLISPAKIGAFDLLRKLYGMLVISAEVYAEVVVAGAGLPGAADVSNCPWIEVREIRNPTALEEFQSRRFALGLGEISAMLLAREIGAHLVLLDDLGARKLAQKQGFKVQGTVAVLEACYRRGHVGDLRQAYERMLQAGVYLDRDLLNGILASLKLSPLRAFCIGSTGSSADCVTSLGGMPVSVDENGIDIAYSCSQKGLGCPPGLAPITVSPRALDRLKNRKTPVQSWYLDLQLIDAFYTGHKYHHTASATLFYALREALALVEEEGLTARWGRHRKNHLAFVAGIEAMGLGMHVANAADRLWTLNTPRVPDGIDDAKVRKYLLEERGMEIAGGFGPLARRRGGSHAG